LYCGYVCMLTSKMALHNGLAKGDGARGAFSLHQRWDVVADDESSATRLLSVEYTLFRVEPLMGEEDAWGTEGVSEAGFLLGRQL